MKNLTPEELQRYSRQLILPGFGQEGQFKLKKASVLVVGAGGLGSSALLYLAAAGVGTIGIADFDRVDPSNLQRQVLYTLNDIGRGKAEAAVERLRERNPLVRYQCHTFRVDAGNALDILSGYDVIVDGTDNFATRYLLNDACVLLDKPLIYGSILQYEGQLSVFNLRHDKGWGPNYRDLFPEPPEPGSVPDCGQAGVVGVLPGIIGTMQANEAIKIITGIGEPLSGKLLILDCSTGQQTIVLLPDRQARQGITSLIDYDDFCGISPNKSKSLESNRWNEMKEITVQELKKLKDSNAEFQLIDVREPHEYDICNLGGELIPMSDIPDQVHRISRDKQVVLHCRSGKRSGDMVLWLEKNHGYQNLYNLKGGILAWAKEIDPEMPTY